MGALFAPRMRDLNIGQKYEMYCYDREVSLSLPRYTLVIMDTSYPNIIKKRTCGAFITP